MSSFDHHPYFVAAYDFAHSRPFKRSLIGLSSQSADNQSIRRQTVEAPSLIEIIASIKLLSSSPPNDAEEETIIHDIGRWLECVEIKPNGKLLEHTTRQQASIVSRGSSSPGTSNESSTTPSEQASGDDHDSEISPLRRCATSSGHPHDSSLPSVSTTSPTIDDRPDVQLLPALLTSPQSFKKRLGQSLFLIPSHSLLLELPSINGNSNRSHRPLSSATHQHHHNSSDTEFYFSISLLHFASISNRPRLVKFLINECEASINVPLSAFVSINHPTSNHHQPSSSAIHLHLTPYTSFGSWTSLMLSTYKDHISVVSILVSHGANIHLRDANGFNALWYALQSHSTLSVFLLTTPLLSSPSSSSSITGDMDNRGTSLQSWAREMADKDLSLLAQYLEDQNRSIPLKQASSSQSPVHSHNHIFSSSTPPTEIELQLIPSSPSSSSSSSSSNQPINQFQSLLNNHLHRFNEPTPSPDFQRAAISSSSNTRLPSTIILTNNSHTPSLTDSPTQSKQQKCCTMAKPSLSHRLLAPIRHCLDPLFQSAPTYLPSITFLFLTIFSGSLLIEIAGIDESTVLPSSISLLVTLSTLLLLVIWPTVICLVISFKQETVQIIPGQTAVEEIQDLLLREDIVLNLGAREVPFPSPPFDTKAVGKEAWRSKHRKAFIKARDESLRLLDASRLCYRCLEMRSYRTYHCSTCNQCIPALDHHCFFLGGCVGASQHRLFVIFMLLSCWFQETQLLLLSYLLIAGYLFNGSPSSSLFDVPVFSITSFLIHALSFIWIHSLAITQIRNVSRNITVCEELKGARHAHFWQERPSATDRGIEKIRHWRNPFDRGTAWKNCLEFWMKKCRSEKIDWHKLKERDMKEFWDELDAQQDIADVEKGERSSTSTSSSPSLKSEVLKKSYPHRFLNRCRSYWVDPPTMNNVLFSLVSKNLKKQNSDVDVEEALTATAFQTLHHNTSPRLMSNLRWRQIMCRIFSHDKSDDSSDCDSSSSTMPPDIASIYQAGLVNSSSFSRHSLKASQLPTLASSFSIRSTTNSRSRAGSNPPPPYCESNDSNLEPQSVRDFLEQRTTVVESSSHLCNSQNHQSSLTSPQPSTQLSSLS